MVRPGYAVIALEGGVTGLRAGHFSAGVGGPEQSRHGAGFDRGGGPGEDPEEGFFDELFDREILEGEFGEGAIVRQAEDTGAEDPVGEDQSLHRRGAVVAGGGRILPGLAPAVIREYVDQRLGDRQSERRAVAFVRQRGHLPGAGGLAHVEELGGGPIAGGVEVEILAFKGLADGAVEGVDELFGGELAADGSGEEAVLGRELSGGEGFEGTALVGVGGEDEAGEVFEIVAACDESVGEELHQLRVGRFGEGPIVDGFDDADAEVAFPDAVDDDLGETLVFGRDDEAGEGAAGFDFAFGGQGAGFVVADEIIKGPAGVDGFTGFEGNGDGGLATAFAKGDGAGDGELQRLAVEHGGHGEEILLLIGMERGVVAAGATELGAEEREPEDLGFGGHGRVVEGGLREGRGSAKMDAAFHLNEFGDEAIEGDAVGEGLVDPVAEGAGVVEIGLEDAGVFGQDVLPVADPVVGPVGMVQEAVDGLGATGGGGERLVGADLVGGGDKAGRIEGEAAEEFEVAGQRPGGEGGGFELGVQEVIDGVVGG